MLSAAQPRPGRRSRARGIALIEALVAMLVFAVGILGAVGMHTTLLREQGAVRARADAAMLAAELIGLMWADYDTLVNQGDASGYRLSSGHNCSSAACSDWLVKLTQTLPSGEATIRTDAASGSTTITIAWTPAHDARHSYVTQVLLR